jgi:death-on-curing protein
VEPRFLTLEEVLEAHLDLIERYGGSAGVRDLGLLQAALAMPEQGFGDTYLHPTLHEMAAAYVYHVIANHPFVDGNKRVGVVCGLVFLDLNGIEFNGTNEDVVEMGLGVAAHDWTKAQVAEFLRARCSLGEPNRS